MKKLKWVEVIKTLLTYMTLVFIALRACGIINWPWYCLLIPAVIPLSVYIICAIIVGIIGIVEAAEHHEN